jgi:hypothetical protein
MYLSPLCALKASVRFVVTMLLLCVPLSSIAQSQQLNRHHNWFWAKLDEGGAASTVSQKYGSDIELLVAFDSTQGCSPIMFYKQSVDSLRERLPEGPLNLEFHARIDSRPLWQIKKGEAQGFYSRDSAGNVTDYYIGLPVNVKFVVDLLQGSTLRVLRVDNSFTDRFSLKGSAVALRSAYALCEKNTQRSADPDLRYFETQPQRPSKPRNQDPDRSYFNRD